EAGQFVVLTAESDEFDTYLELVLDGEVVDEDDDSAGNLNSQISYTADASGTYEVNLNGAFGRNADGAYILMVGEAVSMTDVSTEATAIEPGMEVDGEYNGEYVNYSFYAEAGTLYIITLTSPDFDTYLELYDANDNYMAEDDDSAGSGTDSLIRFSANDSGTYVIKVRSFGMSGSGSYTLSLETVQSVSLTIGEPYVIEADANERNFTFEASADLIYDLYAISDGDDDTYMTLFGPSGEQLGYDDDNGHGYNPFMRALNLPESGMYRLEVGSYSGDDLTSDLTIYLEESDRLFIDDEPTTFVAGERADIEVVAFEVKAGETYRLTVELERNDLYIYGDMLQPEESGMNYSAGSFSLSNMPRGVFDMVAEYDGIMRVQIDFGLYDEETTNVTVSVIRVTDN
ncbi:MAG: PPC domain-containing protein, partial [Anaerolineae bacterium]|nr:PPC domain-containing protein [Anaerolineae bacterium]